MVLAAALVVASCGADEDTAVDPSSTPFGEPAASTTAALELEAPSPEAAALIVEARSISDVLIGATGDESTATIAVLLASDLGYGIGQIVDAAAAGRLQTDGAVLDESGGILPPDSTPLLLLEENSPATGFRSPPGRVGVNKLTQWLGTLYGEKHAPLVLLTALLMQGYSFEQIVTAALTDQRASLDVLLLDENGDVVQPSGMRWGAPGPNDASQGGSVVPTTAGPSLDELAGSATTTAVATLTELVAQAAGVYPVSQDLVGMILAELPDATNVVLSGELVIGVDGVVSGELVVSVTETIVVSDGTAVLVSDGDWVFAPTEVEKLDDGLVFESDVVYHGLWNGEDVGTFDFVATGLVDPEIGQILITGLMVTDSIDTVRFERSV